jgi:hypothetical protein
MAKTPADKSSQLEIPLLVDLNAKKEMAADLQPAPHISRQHGRNSAGRVLQEASPNDLSIYQAISDHFFRHRK